MTFGRKSPPISSFKKKTSKQTQEANNSDADPSVVATTNTICNHYDTQNETNKDKDSHSTPPLLSFSTFTSPYASMVSESTKDTPPPLSLIVSVIFTSSTQ